MVEREKPRRSMLLAIALAFVAVVAIVAVVYASQYRGARSAPESPTQAEQGRTVDEAAQAGLATLRELAAGDGYRTLGLSSSADADNARLGEAYEVYVVGLNQLRGYGAGDSANDLLARSPDTAFPVLVNDQIVASIMVTRTERGFVATEIGSAPAMQATAASGEREAGDFLVRVPALGLQFVGNRRDGRLMLTPIVADPRLQLEPGEEQSAEAVLQQLVPLARAASGDPM